MRRAFLGVPLAPALSRATSDSPYHSTTPTSGDGPPTSYHGFQLYAEASTSDARARRAAVHPEGDDVVTLQADLDAAIAADEEAAAAERAQEAELHRRAMLFYEEERAYEDLLNAATEIDSDSYDEGPRCRDGSDTS